MILATPNSFTLEAVASAGRVLTPDNRFGSKSQVYANLRTVHGGPRP